MKKASAQASEHLQVEGQEEEEPGKVVNIDQAKVKDDEHVRSAARLHGKVPVRSE